MLSRPSGAEDYRQLAAQEAALAKAAVTNKRRAQHYALAAYYTGLAEAKGKLGEHDDVLAANASTAP